VQTALTGVTAALEAQDVEAARKILSDLFQSMAENQQQSLIDRVTSGIKAQVEKLQSMLAAGNLPGGLTQEAVQTALTGVTAALEAQDVEAARKILSDLFRSMAENQQEQTLLERMTAAIKAQLEGIQKAADAGKLPAGVTSEAVSAAIEEATKALESKDIQGARQILANLLKPAVDNDKPAPPAPPVVSLPVAPTPLPIPVPLPNLPVNLPAQVTNVGARIANVAKSFFGR
jgi:ATP-dependent Lon protease